MLPAANCRMSFSCTCTPLPGWLPSQRLMRLKVDQGRVMRSQIRVHKFLCTLINRQMWDSLLDLRGAPKIFIKSSIAPKKAESNITPMGTHVKARDQLKKKVISATVIITSRPPIMGVPSFSLRVGVLSYSLRRVILYLYRNLVSRGASMNESAQAKSA